MSQIERFKGYLFNEERETIGRLKGRLDDVEQRVVDVAEVLPGSLLFSYEDEAKREKLITALKEPVGESIRESIQSDPDTFADALFPVLGPIIRKAVSEAMRALAERLNRTVEHSFSRQGLAWRWESFRTGTPLSDIILRDTLIYRVEQIFVIQRQSGALMAHVQDEAVDLVQDSDAVSAMLTAIQDFVRDSFGAYEQTDLNTVQIGRRTVWIHYGPDVMLASVFFGNPNADLRPEFHAANETLHRLLREADNEGRGLLEPGLNSQVENLLTPLLTSDAHLGGRMQNKSVARFIKPLLGILFLSVGAFGWHGYNDHQTQNRIDELINILSSTPGVVVLDAMMESGGHRIRLLKDPSVILPQDLRQRVGLKPNNARLDIQAFQSSDPAVLLMKIRTFLKAPNSVELSWREGSLRVSGIASEEWAARARGLPFSWLGLERVDFSEMRISD